MAKNKKPKIAFFHCSFVYSGGRERIAIEGVLGLRKKGYKVDLFAPAIDLDNCYPDLLKKANPKPILFSFPEWIPFRDAIDMGISSLLMPFLIFKFLKYDIFIGENQPGVWFAWVCSKLLKKPYIIYLNQPNRMVYPRSIDVQTGWSINKNFILLYRLIRPIKPIVWYLDKVSTREANFMTVNGHYIGNIISTIYGKEFIECPAGCDPFPHGTLKISKDKYYKGKLKINEFEFEKPYILLTNRHYPQKRFDYAISALAYVVKSQPQTKLVITGSFTNITDEWKLLAKKLKVEKSIVWLGEVDDLQMAVLYENAAVYVYTAPNEDYGMGIVEAEEFGVPVVAWKRGGPTVTVEDNKTGLLAKPYDVKDFADKIIWLLSNPEERVEMGKMAHKHVQENFTWERHVQVLEKAVIDSLAGKKL